MAGATSPAGVLSAAELSVLTGGGERGHRRAQGARSVRSQAPASSGVETPRAGFKRTDRRVETSIQRVNALIQAWLAGHCQELAGSAHGAVFLGAAGALEVVDAVFIRGDASGDGVVNNADVVFISNFITGIGPPPGIPDAADVNDDGTVSIGDVVYLANFLFSGGPMPPPPFPSPGVDPTPDTLDCP